MQKLILVPAACQPHVQDGVKQIYPEILEWHRGWIQGRGNIERRYTIYFEKYRILDKIGEKSENLTQSGKGKNGNTIVFLERILI